MQKKKIIMQWNLIWATAHSDVESRYNALYLDTQGKEAHSRRAWTGPNLVKIRPRQATIWPTIRPAYACSCMALPGGVAIQNNVLWPRGDRCVAIQHNRGCDTAQ